MPYITLLASGVRIVKTIHIKSWAAKFCVEFDLTFESCFKVIWVGLAIRV